MKERPINFKAWEVRAILDGRKTQFRRAVRPQPIPDRNHPTTRLEWNPGKLHYTECNASWNPITNAFDNYIRNGRCPFGAPGDRLWVRECHYMALLLHDEKAGVVEYRADYHDELAEGIAWRSSIHMPRWASRIALEVVSVRVERLDEISEEDAIAEGVDPDWVNTAAGRDGLVPVYARLWESINGPDSWEANPFVWVVEFRVAKP